MVNLGPGDHTGSTDDEEETSSGGGSGGSSGGSDSTFDRRDQEQQVVTSPPSGGSDSGSSGGSDDDSTDAGDIDDTRDTADDVTSGGGGTIAPGEEGGDTTTGGSSGGDDADPSDIDDALDRGSDTAAGGGGTLAPDDDSSTNQTSDTGTPVTVVEGGASDMSNAISQSELERIDRNTYTDVDAGDVRMAGGELRLSREAAQEEQRAQQLRAYGTQGRRRAMAEQDIESDLEEQHGRDLEPGEDYTVEWDNGSPSVEYSDQFVEEQAERQVEADAGRDILSGVTGGIAGGATGQAVEQAATDETARQFSPFDAGERYDIEAGEVSESEAQRGDIAAALTGAFAGTAAGDAAQRASPDAGQRDIDVSVSDDPQQADSRLEQLGETADAAERERDTFAGQETRMSDAEARERLREQGAGELVEDRTIQSAVAQDWDEFVDASQDATQWTQENVVDPAADVAGDTAGTLEASAAVVGGRQEAVDDVIAAGRDVARAPGDEEYSSGLERGTETFVESGGDVVTQMTVGSPAVADRAGEVAVDAGEYYFERGPGESGFAALSTGGEFVQSEAERAQSQPVAFAGEVTGGAVFGYGIGRAARGSSLAEGATGDAIRRVDVGSRAVRRGRAEVRGLLGQSTDDLARDSYIRGALDSPDQTRSPSLSTNPPSDADPSSLRQFIEDDTAQLGRGRTRQSGGDSDSGGVTSDISDALRNFEQRYRNPDRSGSGPRRQGRTGSGRYTVGGAGTRGTGARTGRGADPRGFESVDEGPTVNADVTGAQSGAAASPAPGETYESLVVGEGRQRLREAQRQQVTGATAPDATTSVLADSGGRTDIDTSSALQLQQQAEQSDVTGGTPGQTQGPSVGTWAGMDDSVDVTVTPEATQDVSPDLSPDDREDTTPDTSPDQARDQRPDTSPDQTPRASPDITPDVGPDPSPDFRPDPSPDPGPDPTDRPLVTPDIRPRPDDEAYTDDVMGDDGGRDRRSLPDADDGEAAPGWLSEYVTGLAFGAQPREAPSQTELEGRPEVEQYTSTLPTAAQVSDDEEQRERIDEVYEFFGVEDGQGDDSDSFAWFGS